MIDRIPPSLAANAYTNTSNIRGAAGGGDQDDTSTSGAGDAGGVSFSDFLKNETREAIDTMRESEQMSAKAVTGEADLTDVVQAVTAAELTLQTVVSVRDRMVSAYQEILRMPI